MANLNVEGYKKMFKDKNLDFDLYLDEITTELAWQNLIFQLYKNKAILMKKK